LSIEHFSDSRYFPTRQYPVLLLLGQNRVARIAASDLEAYYNDIANHALGVFRVVTGFAHPKYNPLHLDQFLGKLR
jgi:hypothetical protein